jgi:hypothetical protein
LGGGLSLIQLAIIIAWLKQITVDPLTLRSLSPANSAGARMAAVFDPADAPPQPARRPGQGRAELADAELLGRLRAIDEGLAGRLHAAAVECAAGSPQAA